MHMLPTREQNVSIYNWKLTPGCSSKYKTNKTKKYIYQASYVNLSRGSVGNLVLKKDIKR